MRRHTGTGMVAAVFLMAALVACEKQQVDEPVGPPQPVPAPVLATVSVRSGAKMLAGTRAFIDAMKPGTGAILGDGQALALLATIAGVPSLDGVDLAGPLHLLVADDGQARGAVLVGRAAGKGPKERSERGATIVIQNGWVVAGPDALVELVRGYAISTLVVAPAPEVLTITVDVPKVITRYRDQLGAARDQIAGGVPGMPAAGKILTSYIDGTLALAADLERVVIELTATKTRAGFAFAMVPRAGTRLAAFVAAQRPADHALLAKLPAGDPPIVAVGRLALGPYREPLLAMLGDVLGATPEDRAILPPFAALLDASTGDMAATMTMGPDGQVSLTELFALSDEASARAAISAELLAIGTGRTFETMGIKTTMRARVQAGAHGGVTLGSYESELDASTLPPGQVVPKQTPALVGAFDGVMLISMTEEGMPAAARAIDAVRGKAARFVAGPREQPALAESLALEESMIMLMDLDRMMRGMPGSPVLPVRMGIGLALGFAGGNATFRLFVEPR